MSSSLHENEIARIVVDSCFKVHTALGPGLFESVYEDSLQYEILSKGLNVQRQKVVPVIYRELYFDRGYRVDLIVEDKVILEIKSVEAIAPVHQKQLLTYLRLANKRLGLLINFNVPLIKDGIQRVVNNLS